MVKELLLILKSNPENIFFDGASEQQMNNLEHNLGLKLPPSYREFLSITNGALLYQTGELLGTKDDPTGLQTSIKTVRKINPSLSPELIPFCLDGDIACFRVSQDAYQSELAVLRWIPKTYTVIQAASNFTDWLKNYIKSHS